MNHEQNLSLGRSLSPEILSLSVWLLSHSLTGFVLWNETAGNQMTGNLFSHHAWLTPPPMRKFVFVRRRLFPFLCCPSTEFLSEESISSLPSWQADIQTDWLSARDPTSPCPFFLFFAGHRVASCLVLSSLFSQGAFNSYSSPMNHWTTSTGSWLGPGFSLSIGRYHRHRVEAGKAPL